MAEQRTSNPPPRDLLSRIAAAKAEVSKREAERKAAWSCDGHAFHTHLLVAHGFHERYRLWAESVAELRKLERQLAASRAEAAEA